MPLVRRIILPLVLLLLLLVGLWSTLQLIKKKQELRGQASGSDVRLSLFASPETVSVGQMFTVTLYIDPSVSNYHVTATEVPVTYSGSLVSIQAIEVGNFFGQFHTAGQTEMLNKSSITTPGIAKVVLGSPCTMSAPLICYPQLNSTMAMGQLARLTFRANVTGTATIGFDASGVKIAAREYAGLTQAVNVVDAGSLTAISVTVTGGATIPTPTPNLIPTNQPISPTRPPRPTRTPTPSRILR